jgi:hypothetical protein
VPETPRRREVPPPLTVAASIVALQAIVLLGVGILELADLTPERRALGLSTATFFVVYGAVLAAASWALWQLRGWSRGPVLITQLICLGIAWNLREYVLVALGLAVLAGLVIAGTVHPASIRALEGGDTPDRE